MSSEPGLRPSLKRWMALDVGSRTIGLAITDPLKITVRPLTTLLRTDLAGDCRRLLELADSHEVEKLIVGKPLHLDGTPSDILGVVNDFVTRLSRQSDLKIEWMDERLSSKDAEALMAETGIPLKERRRRRNEFAAAVILRRYLEEKS
jgi:putative holliday junction resolvase